MMDEKSIRRLAEEIFRRQEEPCPRCKDPSSRSHPFCMLCGMANPYLSLEEMIKEHGYASIELVQKSECSGWHNLYEAFATPKMSLSETSIAIAPFCPFCGKNILKLGVH